MIICEVWVLIPSVFTYEGMPIYSVGYMPELITALSLLYKSCLFGFLAQVSCPGSACVNDLS